MKIIELLTKIANGEEVPKKIKYLTYIYTLRSDNNYYVENSDSSYRNGIYFHLLGGSRLNDEVEIIEEDKKIEKLREPLLQEETLNYVKLLKSKINEIIDYINKEDK